MNPTKTENQDNTADVKDIDCEFLPLVYEIVKRVEKDPNDASAKNKESLEVANKIQELNKKLEKAKEQVRTLRGIDLNPEEQKQQLAALKNQLTLKKELIHKYKAFATVSNFLEAQNQGAGGNLNSGSTPLNGGTGTGGISALNGTGGQSESDM